MTSSKKTLTFNISSRLYGSDFEAFRALAFRRGITPSKLIRAIIEKELRNAEAA